jgi:hypothetical protein
MSSAVISRQQIQSALHQALYESAHVDAAWEGGSTAFGSDDELSDIDAVAVADAAKLPQVFDAVEQALVQLSPIELRLDMPPSGGYEQKFYRLRDAGEFAVVDLVLLRRGEPLQFREVELHGRGVVWFDRVGVLIESRLDLAADMQLARERISWLCNSFAMFQHLIKKEIRRGRATDALAFYQAWTVRPLVEALRLLHAPHTRIFGMRYLSRDLPSTIVRRVEDLSFARDLAHLSELHVEACGWFEDCITRLRLQGPGAGIMGDVRG